MAQSFYNTQEEFGFDRLLKREGSLSVSCPTRNDSHRDTMERTSSCMSPVSEVDNKSHPPSRRRIQVACNRCRKRKIKCSGDIGDGLGCSNCRNAGNKNCHFLRVNSSMLQTKVNSWGPYPNMNATGSSSVRLGVCPPHMAPKQVALSMSPLNMRAAAFYRQSGYDMGIVDSQNLYGRPSCSVDHGISYDDNDSSAAFNTQSPGYMLPSTPQEALMDYPGIQWSQKTWNPNLNASKAQDGGLFVDQDTEGALPQPSYSYVLPGQEVSSAEIPLVVGTMSLASDGLGTERTLPNPGGRNSQLSNNMPVIPTTSESIPGLSFTHDFRIGNSWTPRPVPASIRASLQPMANVFNPSSATRAKTNVSASQDMTFGYLPITTTDTSPSITSSEAANGPEAVGTTGEPRMTRSFSRDNGRLLSSTEYTPEIYGYSTSEKSKDRDDEPATLMGGLQYTRVKHPDTNAFTFSMLTADTIPDYRPPTEAHRTSISSVGNPNGL